MCSLPSFSWKKQSFFVCDSALEREYILRVLNTQIDFLYKNLIFCNCDIKSKHGHKTTEYLQGYKIEWRFIDILAIRKT